MSIHSTFEIFLILSALLCAMNTGFLFAFGTVVMPGIAKLSDKDFIQAFQRIDGIIQNGQPLFALLWAGSAIALIIATALGYFNLSLQNFVVLMISCFAYMLGVQVSTFVNNIPLNNRLQQLSLGELSDVEIRQAREEFEGSWNRWNNRRTLVGTAVSLALLIIVQST